MDWQTIKTYDDSASEFAAYFKGLGAMIDDIELALKLANVSGDAKVIEIGCGDGRDALEITKRVGWYEGFDPSAGMLKIARQKLPNVSFVKADALSYNYPKDLDVVYAFASLLHVNMQDLKEVFIKVAEALNANGILYISLKERSVYSQEIQQDKYGKRMFYYYNPEIVKEIAGKLFSSVYESHQKSGKTDWFTIALKKNH